MTIDKAEYERIMKRCQVGLAGRSPTIVDEANNLLAECYGGIGALFAEIERLESEAMFSAAGAQSDREQIGVLKAELAGLRTGYDAQNQVVAELRKDAESWQTVLRSMDQLKSDEQGAAIWSACSRILISVASDLNSARSVVTEEGVTKEGVDIGDWRVTVERLSLAKEASHG